MTINSELFHFSKLCWLSLYVLTLPIRPLVKEERGEGFLVGCDKRGTTTWNMSFCGLHVAYGLHQPLCYFSVWFSEKLCTWCSLKWKCSFFLNLCVFYFSSCSQLSLLEPMGASLYQVCLHLHQSPFTLLIFVHKMYSSKAYYALIL